MFEYINGMAYFIVGTIVFVIVYGILYGNKKINNFPCTDEDLTETCMVSFVISVLWFITVPIALFFIFGRLLSKCVEYVVNRIIENIKRNRDRKNSKKNKNKKRMDKYYV